MKPGRISSNSSPTTSRSIRIILGTGSSGIPIDRKHRDRHHPEALLRLAWQMTVRAKPSYSCSYESNLRPTGGM